MKQKQKIKSEKKRNNGENVKTELTQFRPKSGKNVRGKIPKQIG